MKRVKIHPFRLLSIWLLSLLIIFILGRFTVAEKEVETVKYITLTETEYLNLYRKAEQVEEIIEDKLQISLGEYNVSAYCSCSQCCGKSDGITFSGEKAVEGITIAADTRVHPIGTVLYIEGIGERVVQDIGGSIYGNKLDIYFGGIDGHMRALEFGRQYLEVWEVE